jgi:membrane dipeptidase
MRRMTVSIVVLSVVLLLLSCSAPPAQVVAAVDPMQRALELHKEVPLIDGHNDYPWVVRDRAGLDLDRLDIGKPQPSLHTDIQRLREGGVGAQFWSVYVPPQLAGDAAVTATMEQIDIVYQMIERYPDAFELALTADDVERIFRSGRIASLIGMEGGHSINSSLGALRMFHQLGARYMTLTHNLNTPWADSATGRRQHGGLTSFGEEVIREMNRLGMLVDLSHVSPETMEDVIRVSEAPVVFSHSSARALCDVPRNVPDDVLRMMPSNGGVVMVTFVPQFLSQQVAEHSERAAKERARLQARHPKDAAAVQAGLDAWLRANPQPQATLDDVADHIDHVRKVAGIDHVGIGSDFDGITSTPVGLEDVSRFPALTAELLRRGYSDEDVKKVLGLNVLRVMRAAEKVSERLASERRPSTIRLQTAVRAR